MIRSIPTIALVLDFPRTINAQQRPPETIEAQSTALAAAADGHSTVSSVEKREEFLYSYVSTSGGLSALEMKSSPDTSGD